MKIKAILLDFGGTLDSDGIYWYDKFYQICRGQGLDVARNEFEDLAREAGRRIYQHEDIGSLSHGDTVYRLFAELGSMMDGRGNIDGPAAAESFLLFCRPWLESNLRVVRALSRQFRLGVLSNNWGNARGWCDEYGYSPYLDTIIDSGKIGFSKPDPKIFEIGLKNLGLPSEKVVYVGDRFHTDMVGAKNAGLATVWVRHPENSEEAHDGVVDFSIGSLPALIEIANSYWADSTLGPG